MKRKDNDPYKMGFIKKTLAKNRMKEEAPKGLRMYYLVPYNIMPIQKGIQSGHCAEQYAYDLIKEVLRDIGVGHGVMTAELNTWLEYVRDHKTWVILNGGTTNNSKDPNKRGSLNLLLDKLIEGNCYCSTFYEPDLNDALSAICFLADEKVWDFDTYPFREEWENEMIDRLEWQAEPNGAEYYKFIGGGNIKQGKINEVLKEIIYKRPLA